ncbi:MAG: TIM barrel protein [Candidatus Staskawiczbacteria bacterium]|nr:TIM barrel protein [Candidatus Staskawiczbacteria bacterium]
MTSNETQTLREKFPNFGEFMDSFDPRRAVLNVPALAGIDYSKQITTRPGVELGQLSGVFTGPEGLLHCMTFASLCGAETVMASTNLLHKKVTAETIELLSVKELNALEEKTGVKFGVFSGHCVWWTRMGILREHGKQLCQALLPADVLAMGERKIAGWVDDYMKKVIDLSAEKGNHIIGVFDGPVSIAQVCGYAWPFGIDSLLLQGWEDFAKETRPVHQHAEEMGIMLSREIHNGCAATCADEFQQMLIATDYSPAVGVHKDPSHCDEGEDYLARLNHPAVKPRATSTHIKNMKTYRGQMRKTEPRWQKRNKRFCEHDEGDVNLKDFTFHLLEAGVGHRYAALMGTGGFFDLASEAEHWKLELVTAEEIAAVKTIAAGGDRSLWDKVKVHGASARGIMWVRDNLVVRSAGVPFDSLMGKT